MTGTLTNALRYLRRHRGYALLNITGLTVGLALCFFALLYGRFETSYDRYHTKADRIYRLVTDVTTETGTSYESTSAPMAPALRAAFPEVQEATRVLLDYLIVQRETGAFGKETIAYAEPSIFQVFTFPLVSGDPATALSAPYSIVLSETAARTYFGSIDCLNQTLILDGAYPVTVTGIMKDMPHQSHLRTDFLVSMSTLLQEWNPSLAGNWTRFMVYTYLLLPDAAASSRLAGKLPDFVAAHFDQGRARYTLSLEPLERVYLHGLPRGSRTGASMSGDINQVYTLSLVAALVLAIACFNFVNLTLAFSTKRAKEIGVRKVLGASKKQLIVQSLTDTLVLSLAAFLTALVLCALLLPAFNQLAGKTVSDRVLAEGELIGLLFLIAAAVGLLSGAYPGLFLSGIQPAQSLKGRFSGGARRIGLRKTLVVAQFAISTALLIATAVVYAQLSYMQNRQPGFSKEQKLVVDFFFRLNESSDPIKQRLTGLPGVEQASISSAVPGQPNRKLLTTLQAANGVPRDLLSDVYFVDFDFLDQYDINVIAGRPFAVDFASDAGSAMLINESAARRLGYADPREAVGTRFHQQGREGVVIGVVADFNYDSFREPVRPLTLRIAPGWYTFMTLSITARNMPSTIAALESTWNTLVTEVPFTYFFLDEAYSAQYATEARAGTLAGWFSSIALLLSCLGLLGLSAFSIHQRTKEIGVRKVLGASAFSVFRLLTGEFLVLIVVAFLIGAPIAWFGMQTWLDGFAYRVPLSGWIFAAAGASTLLVATATISYHALKAAFVNPIQCLADE